MVNVDGVISLDKYPFFLYFFSFQTYSIDHQTPDSASTASAIYSGVKTKSRTFGFDSSIQHSDPSTEKTAKKVKGILAWAQEADMDTGARVEESRDNAYVLQSAHLRQRKSAIITLTTVQRHTTATKYGEIIHVL